MEQVKYLVAMLIILIVVSGLWSQAINNEGFEGTTFPPAGWINEGNVTRATPPDGLPIYGNYAAYFINDTQGLIVPKMANPYQLTISARQTGNGNCAPRYSYSSSASGPWTIVTNFNNITNGIWGKKVQSVH